MLLQRQILYDEKSQKSKSKSKSDAKSFNCLSVSKDHVYVGLGNGQIVSVDRSNGRVVRRFFGMFVLVLPSNKDVVISLTIISNVIRAENDFVDRSNRRIDRFVFIP